MSKICCKCKTEKDNKYFAKDNCQKDKLHSYCKECVNIISKKYYYKNKEKIQKRMNKYSSEHREQKREYAKTWYIKNKDRKKEYHIRKAFGIDISKYNIILKNQNNKCAICDIDNNNLNRSLVIDHCHKTGKIRGLLCGRCNLMLGNIKDNKNILKKMIKYLNSN